MIGIETCVVCDTEKPAFHWTDTHGVGQCSVCGISYLMYHRNPDGSLQDAPAQCTLLLEAIPYARAY